VKFSPQSPLDKKEQAMRILVPALGFIMLLSDAVFALDTYGREPARRYGSFETRDGTRQNTLRNDNDAPGGHAHSSPGRPERKNPDTYSRAV
jgi:hypothetical protein